MRITKSGRAVWCSGGGFLTFLTDVGMVPSEGEWKVGPG